MRHSEELKKRLIALGGRTIMVGWIGVSLGAASIAIFLKIVASAISGGMGRSGADPLPAVHIPAAVQDAAGTSLLVWAAVIVLLLAIYGFSIGVFRRRSILKVVLIMGFIGAVDWAVNPPTKSSMFVIPSKLEQYIQAGRFDEAEQILAATYVQPLSRSYVKAQIALRANDAVALHSEGEFVLRESDAYIYGGTYRLIHEVGWVEHPAADFNAAVIYALDARINGRPVTGVAREYQERQNARTLSNGNATAVQGAVAGVLSVLSLLVLRLWLHMRRRIIRLNGTPLLIPVEAGGAGQHPADELEQTLSTDNAHCPKCGSDQVKGDDCLACGITISHFREQLANIAAAAMHSPSFPQPWTSPAPAATNPFMNGTLRMPAGKAMQWLSDGWGYFSRNPFAWVGATMLSLICLAMTVWFLQLPLSVLVIILLAPMFMAGFYSAADKQREGGNFTLRHFLFTGNFVQKFRLARVAILELLFMTAIMQIINFMMEYAEPTARRAKKAGDLLMLTVSYGGPLLTAITLLLLLFMASLFAPALVTLHGLNPLTAFRLSATACLKNVLPFLVLGSVLLGMLILSLLPIGLGLLVLIPVMLAAMYSAYRDIFY